MNSLLIYFIQVSVVFSILYLLYRTVLARLTFHAFNRVLLLSLIPISFLLPLVNELVPSIPQAIIDLPSYEGISIVSTEHFNTQDAITTGSTTNYWSIIIVSYWIGLAFSLAKLLFNVRKLILTKQKSKAYQKENHKIIIANVSQIFSFFNWIFIPKEKQHMYDKAIIAHEIAHIKFKHSIDIIITELFIAVFWFNPFVYLYRGTIKSVHEFQADNSVLKKQIKTSHYLQLLLQNLEINHPNNMYSYFNYPILKRRIDMITRNKSTQLAKLQYLLVIPACALFLLAFANPTKETNPIAATSNVLVINDLPPSLFPIKDKSKKDISSTFGMRTNPILKKEVFHGGIDIRAKVGTPVLATADGTTSKAKMEGDWGNLIVISHSDGYQTWYAHLNGFNIKENQEVKKGEVIGYVGNTGLSTAPHLHYEVKLKGERVDPIDYFTE